MYNTKAYIGLLFNSMCDNKKTSEKIKDVHDSRRIVYT